MTSRRTQTLGVVIAVLVIVAILAPWFALRRTATATGTPGLTLLVNLRPRIEITPGTPLVFELSLGSSPSFARLDVGSQWRPWHQLMRVEGAGRARAIPWPIARVGTPRSLHVVRESNGRPNLTEDTSAVARLEAGQHVHTVTLASGPEETATIKPGTYLVRGVLETPFWLMWGWRGRVVSHAATVVVIDPSPRGERVEQLEAERLARTADFYLNGGRFPDAHKAATSLTEIRPKEARSHILLGDALAGLDRRQEALDAFRRAMALIPPSYEEPVLLMERIRAMVESENRR